MSGFEIAGVVLGSIPLIISALEHYQGVFEKARLWRKYTRVLGELALKLGTEESLLKNTCELLLSGIVSLTEIETMVAEPFGELWRDEKIKGGLHWKLDTSLEIFEKNVQQMKHVIDMLKKDLCIAPDPKVRAPIRRLFIICSAYDFD